MDKTTSQNLLIIEAALLANQRPLTTEELINLFPKDAKISTTDIEAAIDDLNEQYIARSFEIKKIASGYRMQLRNEYATAILPLFSDKPQKYSRALLETLALIVYKQPITRGEIEDVRGVAVNSHIIRTLIDRNWIRVVGYREIPGRPAMLATTRYFLDYFNISSLNELPPLIEVKNKADDSEEHPQENTDNQQLNPSNEADTITLEDNSKEFFSELDAMEQKITAVFDNSLVKTT